jgi:hypothetical protein
LATLVGSKFISGAFEEKHIGMMMVVVMMMLMMMMMVPSAGQCWNRLKSSTR